MSVLRRTAAMVVVLGGILIGNAAAEPPEYRYRWCEKRIHQAKTNVRTAIRTYGEDSREAEDRRYALSELREKCSYDNRGGNEPRREWQEYEKHVERENAHHD